MKKNLLSFLDFKLDVIKDYEVAFLSRQMSIVGRKEVLNGRSKFSVFGDGKEVPQVVLSKYMKKGDFRSGYYRDQTMMLALNICKPENLFHQLYGSTSDRYEIFCGGRQMPNHFCTKNVDENGNLVDLTQQINITSDIAPTASQMARALGIAFASSLFKKNKKLHGYKHLSNYGDEVSFCTIGDSATSEGQFWETLNAVAVMQAPMVILVWDDGYGISVPKQLQTVKGSISEALSGFIKQDNSNGIEIITVKGWDYPNMCVSFQKGVDLARKHHIPVLIHVEELTQPLGHSTSGSHERYKSEERLNWEKEWDCLKKMREWIIETNVLTAKEIEVLESRIYDQVQNIARQVWDDFYTPVRAQAEIVLENLNTLLNEEFANKDELEKIFLNFSNIQYYSYRDILTVIRKINKFYNTNSPEFFLLKKYEKKFLNDGIKNYNTNLYVESKKSTLNVEKQLPEYDEKNQMLNGYEILNTYFDKLFSKNPLVVAFGEDVGHIGDVNQGFAGIQQKYGNNRIMDTGIREISIIGQGIGLAYRGLRPIAEIQYLDYLIYGLQPLVDDVATTVYRTDGKQNIPLIVRTRGHRLEGIFHSGSPMGMLINSLRGLFICVPRNMVQAVGFYNTLLEGNDPGLVIECLNGYRLKEKVPNNLLEIKVQLGDVEILKEGTDITIVSYGSTLRIVMEAANLLEKLKKISCEVIDVQTLLPFDLKHTIIQSLKKTNKIIFIDEDVPGGATAFMLQKVIEEQKGFEFLDAQPKTLAAKEHRPAFGNDGDYFSKPNLDDIIDAIIDLYEE